MSIELVVRTASLVLAGGLTVSLWTLRVALTARERRLAASATAGIEAVVFALVFASVLSSLSSPVEIAGYALGVAAGTSLGVAAHSRLSTGHSAVRIVVDGDGEHTAAALKARQWPVTRLQADGVRGAAAIMLVVLDDAAIPRLLSDLSVLTPEAFWTIERLQSAKHAATPAADRRVRQH